jgi:hypothetical protein
MAALLLRQRRQRGKERLRRLPPRSGSRGCWGNEVQVTPLLSRELLCSDVTLGLWPGIAKRERAPTLASSVAAAHD